MIFSKQVGDSTKNIQQPLFVRAWGISGYFADFVIQVVQLIFCDADGLCSIACFFQQLPDLGFDPSTLDQTFTL